MSRTDNTTTTTTYKATVQQCDQRRSFDSMVRKTETFTFEVPGFGDDADDRAIEIARARVLHINDQRVRSARDFVSYSIDLTCCGELIAVIHFDGRVA